MSTHRANLVGHCKDTKENHDKLYIACIRVTTKAFEVIGKWGRVGHTLSEQPKGMFPTLHEAWAIQNSLFASKVVKGYVDIESVGYKGSLTLDHFAVKPYLEPDIVQNVKQMQPADDPKTTQKNEFESVSKWPIEVLCVDNSGFEEKFDLEVTYIATGYSKGPPICVLTVFDKFGKPGQFLSERFRRVST